MRHLRRATLLPESTAILDDLQKHVNDASAPAPEAEKLWRRRGSGRKRTAAFDDVRAKLRAMAPGRSRCMYCEDSLGTDIEHFRPKSVYPDSAFAWSNYLLACSHCNSNEKRTEFPLDANGGPLLIDPTAEDPRPHLVLVPETGIFVGLTERGVETIRVFGLNRRDELEQGRRNAWTEAIALLRNYDRATNPESRAKDLDALRTHSFSSVVAYLFALAERKPRVADVPADIVGIVQRHRAAFSWIPA